MNFYSSHYNDRFRQLQIKKENERMRREIAEMKPRIDFKKLENEYKTHRMHAFFQPRQPLQVLSNSQIAQKQLSLDVECVDYKDYYQQLDKTIIDRKPSVVNFLFSDEQMTPKAIASNIPAVQSDVAVDCKQSVFGFQNNNAKMLEQRLKIQQDAEAPAQKQEDAHFMSYKDSVQFAAPMENEAHDLDQLRTTNLDAASHNRSHLQIQSAEYQCDDFD